MKALQEPKEYMHLLERSENWLKARIKDYAGVNNLPDSELYFRKFCSVSLCKLIRILIQYSEPFCHSRTPSSKQLNNNSLFNGTVNPGINKQLLSNVPLPIFLCFLKQLRQAVYDLFRQMELPAEQVDNYCLFAGLSFDRIEFLLLELQIKEKSKRRGGVNLASSLKLKKKDSYYAIFESLFTPVILLNGNNKIINFNKQAGELFPGLRKNSYLLSNKGRDSKSLRAISYKVDNLRENNTEEAVFELKINHVENTAYYKVLLKQYEEGQSRMHGTIVMFQDLTEQYDTATRLADAKSMAEEADKLKTSFLANMSHEIRTPMNAIVGFAELLLNDNYKQAEAKTFLKMIRNSSKGLLNIIEDIIDIAKLESKQLKIKYKPCKVYDIMGDLQMLFKDALRRYGVQDSVELKLDVGKAESELVVNTDGERLKQILTNLLSNAVKFTHEGYIHFGFRRVDASNLLFFVKDTGAGIPENMIDKVFERFYQVDNQGEGNLGGAGLGLAICKNIVNLLGGKIWLESVIDKGSAFYFQIPCNIVAQKKLVVSKTEKSLIPDNFPDFSSKTILIAEDDDINYIFLEELLKLTGAEIIRAKNGHETINFVESVDKISIILMDIKMPEVSGIEAARYIHSVKPEVPIIAQTAFAMEGDKKSCLDAGCSAYITKPVDRAKLFMLMERYIKLGEKAKKQLLGAK